VDTSAEALVADLFDAMNTGELEKVHELVTDDFVDHSAPVLLPPGPDGYIAVLAFITNMLRIRYEVHDIVPCGDTVAIRATAHGVDNISPQGFHPTGRPYAMQTAHFYRCREDRLSDHWGVRDELDVLYQVGALAPPHVTLG
jgi:predicted ester cyclase